MKEPPIAIDRPVGAADAARGLPVLPPITALIEIAVLFAALNLADWFIPGIELGDIRPHPYWLPVLLLSLQYGMVSGLIAAAVAIGLTAQAGFPEQGTSETYFAYLIKIWLEPMLWIGAAVLFGQFRMRQISRKQELINKVEELAGQRAALADYAQNLRRHCDALERQLARRTPGDAVQLLHAMHRAVHTTGDEAAIGVAFRDLVARAVPGAQASLYAVETDGLVLRAATSGPGEAQPAPRIPSSDPLHAAVIGAARRLSVLEQADEAALGSHGLVAVPVGFIDWNGAAPTIIGMLKIDGMPPNALDTDVADAFAALGAAMVPLLRPADRAVVVSSTGRTADHDGGGAVITTSQKLWRHLRWFRGDKPEQIEPTDTLMPPPARSVTR